MMTAYHKMWKPFSIKYHAVEHEFMCKTPKGKWLAGICDAIVFHEGRWWIMETKTAARLDDDYIKRMRHKMQPMMYVYALKKLMGDNPLADGAHYRDIAGVLYDFIQKPAMRRKKATPPDKLKFTTGGEPYKSNRDADEHNVDYINRMHDWYEDNKHHLMRRVEVVYSDSTIDSFAKGIHKTIRKIDVCREEDLWTETWGACQAYNRPCEFAAYCHSASSPMVLESFYKKREKRFAEFRKDIGGKDDSNATD